MSEGISMATAAWVRLGKLLIQRRTQLDPRYMNRRLFADDRGLDYRLVSDIERARRQNFEESTLAAIEVAYAWSPDSIQRILDGGDPVPLAAGSEPAPAALEEPTAEPADAAAPEMESAADDTGIDAVVYDLTARVNATRKGHAESRTRAEIRAAKASYRNVPLSQVPESGTEPPSTNPDDSYVPGEAFPTFDAIERALWGLVVFSEEDRLGLIVTHRVDREFPTRIASTG